MTTPQLGRLRAVTIVCAELDSTVAAYRDFMGYRELEAGRVSQALAGAWRAPAVAGRRYAVLGPASGADTVLRFIEIPGSAPYAPYSSHGWNVMEITVADCDAAVAQLARGPFRVVGEPHDLGFSDGALRAGQLVGPLGEIIYLTQVRRPVPGFELPAARTLIDRVFIVVLHGTDAAEGIRHYQQRFGNAGSDTFEVAVDFMAVYQGLPPDHPYRIGTVTLAPGFYFEVDGSPPHIGRRVVPEGGLPAGIAMLTLETPQAPDADAVRPEGVIYGGAGVARIEGAFGEWLELIS